MPSPSADQSRGTDTSARPRDSATGQKRNKYTIIACADCQRRKVKCSGEDICYHCRARDVHCVYPARVCGSKRKFDGEQEPRTETVAPRQRQNSSARLSSTEFGDSISASDVSGQDGGLDNGARDRNDTNSQSAPSARSIGLDNNDSIVGRVQALERMLKVVMQPRELNSHDIQKSSHSREWPSVSMPDASMWESRQANGRGLEVSPPLSPLYLEDEDPDIFKTSGSPRADLSLSSQLAGLEDAVGRSQPPFHNHRRQEHDNIEVRVCLPTPSKLRTLLDVYFSDVDSYFPFVDREQTEARISKALRQVGYGEHRREVMIGFRNLSLMSLLFNMLAMAECLNSELGARDDARPGWALYLEGFRLAQRFSCTRNVDLDLVCHHVLGAAYLLHSELLRSASKAVLATYQFATVIRLHDQKAWPDNSPTEVAARQRLWWTLYWLDRRIAQKSGLAYHIRDQDFSVEDFSTRLKADQATSPPNFSSDTDKRVDALVWMLPFRPDAQEYLQVMINLGKLWGMIWDAFFAAGANKLGDWEEIELMDTRILNVRRQLPPNLTWDPDLLQEYTTQGQREPALRRRIGIHTRLNLLRTLIRHSPLHPESPTPDTVLLCAQLASDVIHSHAAFNDLHPCSRSSGYFTAVSMVECVYHLIPVLRDTGFDEHHTAAVVSLRTAYNIVLQLSQRLNVARHATTALVQAMARWGQDTSAYDPALDGQAMDELTEANNNHSRATMEIFEDEVIRVDSRLGPTHADMAANVSDHLRRPNELFSEQPYLAISAAEFDTDADLGVAGWNLDLTTEPGLLSQEWMDREL